MKSHAEAVSMFSNSSPDFFPLGGGKKKLGFVRRNTGAQWMAAAQDPFH
ncbi:MAG: hypothetical protein ACE3JK_11510 [Sporolactobacillus sp.]